MKSGCKIEDCLLETGQRLVRYLTVIGIIGVRLMQVRYLHSRAAGPARHKVFSKEEIEALHARVHKALPPAKPPALREVVCLIGRVSGHLDASAMGSRA